jgi:hypothetical protein
MYANCKKADLYLVNVDFKVNSSKTIKLSIYLSPHFEDSIDVLACFSNKAKFTGSLEGKTWCQDVNGVALV